MLLVKTWSAIFYAPLLRETTSESVFLRRDIMLK